MPENILGQLGNRVQHALRAYTPKDQKAVRVAADTFRANPEFKTEEAISTLETGEALVSFLDGKGAPGIVQRAKILFPLSQIGAITDEQRQTNIRMSRIYGKYDTMVDSESAYEVLMKEEAQSNLPQTQEEDGKVAKTEKEAAGTSKKKGLLSKVLKAVITALTATLGTIVGTAVSDKVTGKKTKSKTNTAGRVVKNTTSAATRTITREITRDILGNLIK